MLILRTQKGLTRRRDFWGHLFSPPFVVCRPLWGRDKGFFPLVKTGYKRYLGGLESPPFWGVEQD